MIFDADDLVSRRIAAYANQHPNEPGWFVDSGYTYNYASTRIQRKFGLVRHCGTSLVPNYRELLRLGGLSDAVVQSSSWDEILEKVGRTFVERILGNHSYMVGFFARHGLKMKPLPFAAAAWVLDYGENQSVTTVATGLPMSRLFAEEFGIDPRTSAHLPTATIKERLEEAANAGKSWLGALRPRILGHLDENRIPRR